MQTQLLSHCTVIIIIIVLQPLADQTYKAPASAQFHPFALSHIIQSQGIRKHPVTVQPELQFLSLLVSFVLDP